MLSEKGSLKETPALKLLLTIFEQGLTGILYIKREDILKVLYFSRGKLIWAISNSDIDKIENILVAKNLVNLETMKQIKKQARVSDSIGKLLVEKGLITLEELIDSTKEQLKRIIISVLKWKEGGFQFIKDAPPERLLSLDLDITQFVVNFIIEEVDISDIWKEIGSLQVEFIKNPDEQKLAKYHLSDKQLELLQSFDGEKKLEAILSRHSGGHRESLLKIIYFFLMAELLIKKEFELSDPSAFEDNKSPDIFIAPVKHVEPLETPETIDTVEPFDTFDYTDHVEPIETGKSLQDQDYSYIFQEDNKKIAESPVTPPITSLEEAPEEKKKRSKFFNVTLIMVFLSLVIGGMIFILLGWLKSTDDMNHFVDQTDKKGISDIIKIEEKTPPSPDLNTDTTTTGADQTGETANQAENKEPPTGKKDQEPEVKKNEEVKKDEEIKTSTKPKPEEQPPPAGKSAEAYFQEKSFITAGDVWKRELIKHGVKYSILLEMDCMKPSVINAYNRIEDKKAFFILNRKVGNKTCFLVMLGKFRTYEEATQGIKSVPNYFWGQKDPPEIVELSKYF